jgi:flagellar FliL protein
MSTAIAAPPASAGSGGRKKLVLLAVPLLLGGAGAGLWFGGVLPPLLGMGKEPHAMVGSEAASHGPASHEPSSRDAAEASAGAKAPAPIFVELPELITNLDAGPRRTSFLKLHAKLELAKPDDQPIVAARMPRLLDLFQTYLREIRPDELRGAAGTYRLREELIARADIAAAPAKIVDILFTEILVQ